MQISTEKLKELLIRPGHISKADFAMAEKEAEKQKKELTNILIEKELIKDEQLGKLIAEEINYKFIDLQKEAIAEDILKVIPELVAKNQKIIAFAKDANGIKIAMADPSNQEMIGWLAKKTGETINTYYATPRDIQNALRYYRPSLKHDIEKLKTQEDEQAIIKLVDILIQYAYENRASDIHIEPGEEETQIRYRIDGVLHEVVVLPKNIHDLVIMRVKVLAKLRTDEHMAAQDGKFTARPDTEKFDIRVSVAPVTEGEKVVMRLLSEKARQFSLADIGLSEKNLQKVQKAMAKPYGMILATGPTGCGKTTTLYTILKILNKPEVNIATIEDPVEYDIEGVNQIQINPKTNLTFAKGLRSIVRQDPDIIMVGEIRDQETSGIAVNSAMTGHLVLSTMHANTASTVLPRLIDMGIEPFLVASSVNVVIAQRLVRKICIKCRESYIFKKAIEECSIPAEERVYRGKGCKSCGHTGYAGRIGIFEVLEMQENIKELIMQRANADQIQEQAIKNKMTTMMQNGIEKVLNGITTIEEILRVTRK